MMNDMEKCLYCYKTLKEGQEDYHPACARKMFGTTKAPILPYSRKEVAGLAAKVIRSSSTVTGVQAKLSLDIEKTAHGAPRRFTIVGLWGAYILKPQTEQFRSLPELEDLTMHLAQIAGIATVPHSLIRFSNGELSYITKRIDRGGDGEKFAMEDMCQLTERLTEYKYKGSYEQIAKTIVRYSSTPKLDVVNFWEQVIFSWITGNADMHLKNFSIYSRELSVYQLAPAYDMLSTYLVMPEDIEELALTLNGKKRKLNRDDFRSAVCASGLDEKMSNKLLNKFTRFAPKWMEMIDISFLPKDMKEAYKELIIDKLEKLSMG